jgi:hypothetical protein
MIEAGMGQAHVDESWESDANQHLHVEGTDEASVGANAKAKAEFLRVKAKYDAMVKLSPRTKEVYALESRAIGVRVNRQRC